MGYRVNKKGEVFSRYKPHGGKLTKCTWHKISCKTLQGYKLLRVHGKNYKIHRIVATLYVPNPHNKPIVCHKDNVRTNNHYKNLYWGTYKENTQQCIRDGRFLANRRHHSNKNLSI